MSHCDKCHIRKETDTLSLRVSSHLSVTICNLHFLILSVIFQVLTFESSLTKVVSSC